MFINITNHPSKDWSNAQVVAAEEYGEILDVAFPSVPPIAQTKDVMELADTMVDLIAEYSPECVLCQGEFCLCYAIISKLKARGIKVVAACTERIAKEKKTDDGQEKYSYFKFVQFREYCGV